MTATQFSQHVRGCLQREQTRPVRAAGEELEGGTAADPKAKWHSASVASGSQRILSCPKSSDLSAPKLIICHLVPTKYVFDGAKNPVEGSSLYV